MENKKNKKYIVAVVLFSLGLIMLTVQTTYSFFNYTRTGIANTFSVGRVTFTSTQDGSINLTNAFPITSTEAETDTTNAKSVSITISGDTDYQNGVEYLISASDVNLSVGYKDMPVTLEVEVDSNGNIGTVETGDYYANRESYSTSKYKIEYNGNMSRGSHILVGYIAPNTTSGTIEGINGTINIKAFIDKDKIAITDTPNENREWQQGRVVFTTSEWNSIQGSPLSFKIKVEANEGIWVKEPLSAYGVMQSNADTVTQIDFVNASSDTNGKGLYILPGTESDVHPIYYYRGAIDNNNVLFGGFCWQIVRTTETGGIKMIYNGLPDIEGSGDNTTYNCGVTRNIQDNILSTTSLQESTGYYYADDYEIVSTEGNSVTYRLKSKTNPITQVAIQDASGASTNIPTIATSYPYTCKQTTESATCTTIYKVDSYASETNANVYSSLDRPIIGRSAFNTQYSSVSDVGYMSNTRYPYSNSNWTALFASNATWVTDHYELVDASVTTPDTTHHYSCNQASASTTCTSLRYVYYANESTKYYITLTNGELIEDALYKMTGNGSAETKTKNAGYNLNVNNSTVKETIDNWFRENLTSEVDTNNPDYSTYLEDTVFCNDRSYKETGSSDTYTQSGWNHQGGSLSTLLYFGTHNRYKNSWYSTSNVPSITCPNETDRFTVSNANGNGALTYPVGLLTADEIIMAGVGGNNGSTSTYYLYTNDYYWSLAPFNFYHNIAYGVAAYYSSLGGGYGSNSKVGLRPVVSLRLGTEFETGGDGTGTNPYVVKMVE